MVRNSKGITLVALVITIIIMLILAGVTISIIVNGGLFGQAQNAVTAARQGKVDDEVGIWRANNKASEYLNGAEYESAVDFIERLLSNGTIESSETDGTNTITIGDRTWVLEGESNQYAGIEIGSYVDYKPTSRKLSN